ncbi:phosphoglycerate dehydrogenase [Thermomicrobiaceae bacterium CFH 74404]|uniref:D-3-phosphoglycerate dehydrogenase n=1 Tax=Thermalbibacter longus TaxID=2951981 RepID=A0AA42BD68_9BACT|nr:phosphoglycerate dehydrogenase [Thermalbibacter longus]MCM8749478.1 phosphoglycerate dehydrogenase [Thermalbibacter longus]
MEKLTIRLALDLDGVLTEHPAPLAQAANRALGMQLPDHAFVDSAGCNVPDAVREWVYGPGGPASLLEAAPRAQELLQRLLDTLGAENVWIVTARPARSRAVAEDWLRRHRFPACRIEFADDKVEVARALGVTHAIEDSLRHATCYARAGITCFLLSSEPAPADESPLVVRVPDLAQAIERILSLAGEIGPVLPQANARWHEPEDAEPRRRRIVISDLIDEKARQRLAAEADIVDIDGRDRAALLKAVQDADALIVRSETLVTREVLAAAPRLRVIARAGSGVDNIDLEAATQAGILVLNAPGANAVSAGEHTIALMLAIARCVPEANASTHAGRWERKRFKPFDLKGKTVGIVGLGRVGSVVAQRLRAFEVRLLGYDPYITRERFAQLGVEPVDYETLLENVDIITFHVPATPETHHMLDADAIARLRPGAIVINCARGEVVDPVALAEALQRGHVAAAGIDVFPEEPAYASPLFGLPNVVLTPHIGGSSREALEAVGEIISTTTLAALRGEIVPNAVNLPAASLRAPELLRLTQVADAAGHLIAVLQPNRPSTFAVTVRGQVAPDVAEHVTAAALSSALRRWSDRRVTPVNARLVAAELNLLVSVRFDSSAAAIPEFSFEVDGESPHHVTVRWDRKDAGIMEVDRFSLERPLAGHMLITHHRDRPGIVGQIGTILGRYEVNIAGMQVGRHQRGGEAIMVLNVDDPIPEEALAEILTIPHISTAYVVSLPEPAPQMAGRPVRAALSQPAD